MQVFIYTLVGIILGIIIGFIIGVLIMSLVQASKEDVTVKIKILENSMENERADAIKEKKDINYINGMSRIVALFKVFFKEEF